MVSFLAKPNRNIPCYSIPPSLSPSLRTYSPKSKSPQQKNTPKQTATHQPAAPTAATASASRPPPPPPRLLEASNTRRNLLGTTVTGRAPQGSPRRRPRLGGRAEIVGERSGSPSPTRAAPGSEGAGRDRRSRCRSGRARGGRRSRPRGRCDRRCPR